MDEIAGLIEPHVPALRRYAWALLRDEAGADDLVQDCLERSLSRWHLRRDGGDLRAWLFTILHNLFIDGMRRRRREGLRVDIDEIVDLAAPAQEPESRLVVRDVLDAVESLPADQRAVLLLVCVEDLSYEAAARVLGVPIGTVMSRLSRARERLRRLVTAPPPPVLRRVK
ncbi:sigma-70 family RNA polymerase sigma factor [Enterovirga rhinocerotis]|uniref:RNA polymerase sigma-70 factor (ECF subfamily) n=1 Tax=Enterovirga rhinocerotis TaxID=1339210 RepID=A0A4R7BPC4_9HYPH|nr:sigma-70 family RNA polymerase sigma factor [Enterovirga rhinocerotis]TDR87221.1 RNA polymerase sigma-70 factor (ECF subfamily) [Enterovirga rhinocerotis]